MSVTDCSQDLIMEYTMKYFFKKKTGKTTQAAFLTTIH